jgi:predicted membrane-bound spermidine synthase
VTAALAARRPRLASSTAALVLGVFVLVLFVTSVANAEAHHIFAVHDLPTALLVVATAAVGVIVARHLPANPMGWILLGVGSFAMLSAAGTNWLLVSDRFEHGRVPLGWLVLLMQIGWAPTFTLFGLVVQLFPDGRPMSRPWRVMMWLYSTVALAWIGGAVEISLAAIVGHHVIVDASGELASLDNPSGATAWWGQVQNVFFWVLGLSLLLAVGRQVASFIRSGIQRREQLKWALSGTIVSVASGWVTFTFSDSANAILSAIGNAAITGVVALPVGIGVAILKYRLYAIDRIISRTLAYTIVTAVLAGLYAGLVLLATQVLGLTSQVAVAAATLAAAALFNPMRRRVQHRVDRRFNRARYDADNTVAAFAARLQDATDPDAVRSDLLGTVHRALEPAQVSLWLAGSTR